MRSWTLLIGGVALAARLLFVFSQRLHIGPTADAGDYERLAVSLAHSHGWGTSVHAPGGGPTAFRPPLYPLFLAGVYKVFGVHPDAARVVQSVLGALGVMCLVALTAMFWDRRVAITAGVVAALFPPMLMVSSALMSESLAIPIEIATITAAVAFRRTGRLWWMALAGAGLGLDVLTRPNLAVLVVPVVALGVIRPFRRHDLAVIGVVLVCGTAVCVPWLVRDRLAFGQWVPLTTQSGVVLAGTYNATSAHLPNDPAAWLPYIDDPADVSLVARHRHAGEMETSSLLQSAATSYVRAHPGYVAEVVFENTRRLFDLVPLGQTRLQVSYSYDVTPGWGDVDLGCALALLGLAACGVALRRGRAVPLAYLAAPVIIWITTVALQAMPRMRAALDPFLVQLAAVALVTAWTKWGRRTAPPVKTLPEPSQ
ncbi:MAG: ArnT family glycosyltransferase [Acidimicrobiales bacterium]